MSGLLKLFAVLVLVIVSACSNEGSSKTGSGPKSNSTQNAFCRVVDDCRVAYSSEKKKDFYIDQKAMLNNIFAKRREDLKSVLQDGSVENWEGTIDNITVYEGKGAWLKVKLSCGIYLIPQDNLIISIDSSLYQGLRRYSEGSKIRFSGHFLVPPDTGSLHEYPYKSYYGETSFGTSQSVRKPGFLFKFTAFHSQ